MPSIEIISVGQRLRLELPGLPFAVASEPELRSHRMPPRWQADFDRLEGWIYHLGNPDLRDGAAGSFFAYELLSERSLHDCHGLLEFAAPFHHSLQWLLGRLMAASPTRRIVVTTDWQFGPATATRGRFGALLDFWRAHDTGRLRLNSFYDIGSPTV